MQTGAKSPSTPGRPRDPRIEKAILDAAVELIAQGGLEAASVAAVAERSGVARATIYLRWPSRAALIAAAVRHALRREPMATTGDLESDIRQGVQTAFGAFSEPDLIAILPAVVRASISREAGVRGVTFDLLFPGRASLADEYKRLAAEQGFRADVEPTIVFDLIAGAMLSRALGTAEPPTPMFARQVTEAVLAGLRAPVSDGPAA
jgi:AcrR family transcriptional regulator